MDKIPQRNVAVVGSGMAGLVTAYLLSRDRKQRYAVTLFEERFELSLDSASLSIPNPNHGTTDRIALPMRAFAGGFYNNLKNMYDHLGVAYHSQLFLFAFSRVGSGDDPEVEPQKSRATPYFVHSSNNHRIPPLRPEGRGIVVHVVEILYLSLCYAWFTVCCALVPPHWDGPDRKICETLDDYLTRIMLPRYFVTHYLLPLISSVTTCSHRALLDFPARDLVEYKRRTHGAPHYVVSNGIRDAQVRLANGIQTKLSTKVSAVEAQNGKVKLSWTNTDNSHSPIQCEGFFDEVVLAVSPDIVAKIFAQARYEMGQIPTVRVESTVHTNKSQVGERAADDSDAQMIHLRTSLEGAGNTESVHIQASGVIVTTCPSWPINPDQVIQTSKFTRVLRTPASRRILNRIFHEDEPEGFEAKKKWRDEKVGPRWRSGDDGVWLVGGWCWDGMVLLEGCVVSAMRVADRFGVDIPWRDDCAHDLTI